MLEEPLPPLPSPPYNSTKPLPNYIMGTCQNDWLVTGALAHTRYIPRYIGYVTEGGFRDIPQDSCPAEDMKAARQGVCNRLAFQGVCNRGLVARNATTPLFGTPPY